MKKNRALISKLQRYVFSLIYYVMFILFYACNNCGQIVSFSEKLSLFFYVYIKKCLILNPKTFSHLSKVYYEKTKLSKFQEYVFSVFCNVKFDIFYLNNYRRYKINILEKNVSLQYSALTKKHYYKIFLLQIFI